MPRVAKRSARSTRGWRHVAPHAASERRALLEHCGEKAFLDPARLKFPVVAKVTTKAGAACEVDCRALRTAKQRASQYRHPGVERKADALAARAGCSFEVAPRGHRR